MRIIRGALAASEDRGTTAALGNFDGVHRGHASVLAVARAAAPDAPLAVATFDPHPRHFFNPGGPPFELMDFDAKARRLAMLGVSRVFALPFDADLAAMSPAAFCEDIIAKGLGLSHVTVGDDFCFGAKRAGTVETLREQGARLGFGVSVAPLHGGPGAPVSSTAIRRALAEGRPGDAAAMLGHRHRIEGVVEHGEKRGRELGYPTANLSLGRLTLPRFGVYAVTVDVLDGPHAGCHRGVASLGVRPMFGENRPNLETFLFDFSGDLYGARISVALIAFQRPELSFDSLDALIAQMDADAREARDILAAEA